MKAEALPLDLPDYIEVANPDDNDNAPGRYFLAINRTAKANWSAAYMEFEFRSILLSINDADTLEEIATRLRFKLQRHKKHHPDHVFVSAAHPGV